MNIGEAHDVAVVLERMARVTRPEASPQVTACAHRLAQRAAAALQMTPSAFLPDEWLPPKDPE